VDVADLVLPVIDLVERVRYVNGGIESKVPFPETIFYPLEKGRASALADRYVHCFVAGGFREEPGHVAIGIVQVTWDRGQGRSGGNAEQQNRGKDNFQKSNIIQPHPYLPDPVQPTVILEMDQ
jgi:hypothetical protein